MFLVNCKKCHESAVKDEMKLLMAGYDKSDPYCLE